MNNACRVSFARLVVTAALVCMGSGCDAGPEDPETSLRDKGDWTPGPGDIDQGQWVWQPIEGREVFEYGGVWHFDPNNADLSEFGETNTTGASVLTSSSGGVRLLLDGDFTQNLPEHAAPDLIWAGVNFECADEPVDVLVLVYLAEGETVGINYDPKPNDYFRDRLVEVAGTCNPTAVIGQQDLGNGLRAHLHESLDTFVADIDLDARVTVSYGDPEFNQDYIDAAFSETVWSERVKVGFDFSGNDTERNWIVGRGGDERAAGEYRLEADCGFGYEPFVPLDELAKYGDVPLSIEDGLAAYTQHRGTLEDCDVRIGILAGGPQTLPHDVGQAGD